MGHGSGPRGIDWYSTGAHEMHHRRPDKNFAQFTMFWALLRWILHSRFPAEDKLMGTFVPYDCDVKAEKGK